MTLPRSGHRVCACVHLFNTRPEVRAETLGVIQRIGEPVRAYVHLDRLSTSFADELVEAKRLGMRVVVSDENRGADIGGKLLTIEVMLAANETCPFVLFIHSKSEAWMRTESLAVAATTANAQRSLRLLGSAGVGMVGAAGLSHLGHCIANGHCPDAAHVATAKQLERNINERSVNALVSRLGLPELTAADWDRLFERGFVAGSMFWVRKEILDRFRHVGLLRLYGELAKGYTTGNDGCLEHAMERVFGLMVTKTPGHDSASALGPSPPTF